MAERKGSLLRRVLASAERFSERAISSGSSSAKTPFSRSSALLVRVTPSDHSRSGASPGFLRASFDGASCARGFIDAFRACLACGGDVTDEPVAGDFSDALQRSRLLEEMGGAGDDVEARLAAKPTQRPSVELEHFMIEAADDQQRGRFDMRQALGGEVGASAARHDGGDRRRLLRRGDQGRGGSRAGAEEPDGKIANLSFA